MSDNKPLSSLQNLALGHLIIESAPDDSASPGSVSDEELARFAEGDPQINHQRRQEIIAALAQNPALYAQWINLVQTLQDAPAPNKQADQAINDSDLTAGLTAWLQSFFTPQVGMAVCLSVALATLVTLQMVDQTEAVGSDTPQRVPLAVHEGRQAPARAAIDHINKKQTQLHKRQIIATYSHNNRLTIHYKQAGKTILALYELNVKDLQSDTTVSLTPVFEERTDGEIDSISLDGSSLNYRLKLPGSEPEKKHYNY